MTVKSSISLTDTQADFARNLVKQGRYTSLSSVVQQGLDLLHQKTEADEAETRALQAFIAERREGPFVSAADMRNQTACTIAEKRRARGLDG